MSLALKAMPPAKDGVRVVDGGIALRHSPWLTSCHQFTAFAYEELTPLPAELTCAHCGETTPLTNPDVRAKLAELLRSAGRLA